MMSKVDSVPLCSLSAEVKGAACVKVLSQPPSVPTINPLNTAVYRPNQANLDLGLYEGPVLCSHVLDD